MGETLDLPQGTLELLILKTLVPGPRHGWAVGERLRQISAAALRVGQGSLYPALHRLERRGWIRARWGVSAGNRRVKLYELTAAGRRRLSAQEADWHRLTGVVALVLQEGAC